MNAQNTSDVRPKGVRIYYRMVPEVERTWPAQEPLSLEGGGEVVSPFYHQK